jgi:hypothetical protein
MPEIVAYCGLVCTECPTYQATKKNDNKARAKIAEEWSKEYKHVFKPEDINCSGCLTTGDVHIGYCNVCEIRRCGSSKRVLNCGYCAEYPCDKLSGLHTRAPKAKSKLDAIRRNK